MSSQLELHLGDGPATREVRLNARVRCVVCRNRVRVQCVSECQNPNWFCSFPKQLRITGIEYQVSRLIAMRKYYRASGEIVPIAFAIAPLAIAEKVVRQ